MCVPVVYGKCIFHHSKFILGVSIIYLKITKMARPHKRPMSKRPDCYELNPFLRPLVTLCGPLTPFYRLLTPVRHPLTTLRCLSGHLRRSLQPLVHPSTPAYGSTLPSNAPVTLYMFKSPFSFLNTSVLPLLPNCCSLTLSHCTCTSPFNASRWSFLVALKHTHQ